MSKNHQTTPQQTPQERIEELEQSLVRTQADYANYRTRTEREREDHKKRATQHLVKDILGVIDHLELALSQESATKQDLVQGVELVLSQFITILEDYGVTRVPTDAFDASLHEAILKEPSKETKGTIIEVLQQGYTLGGMVLRTAKVKVSQGPEETHHE